MQTYPYTLEETQARVLAYAESMPAPGINDTGDCTYDGPTPCPVGHIMKDFMTPKEISRYENINASLALKGKVPKRIRSFLSDAQHIHDTLATPKDWTENCQTQMVKQLKELVREYQ